MPKKATPKKETPSEGLVRSSWNDLRGFLKQDFPALTEEDLRYAKRREAELIERIRSRLAMSEDEVASALQKAWTRWLHAQMELVPDSYDAIPDGPISRARRTWRDVLSDLGCGDRSKSAKKMERVLEYFLRPRGGCDGYFTKEEKLAGFAPSEDDKKTILAYLHDSNRGREIPWEDVPLEVRNALAKLYRFVPEKESPLSIILDWRRKSALQKQKRAGKKGAEEKERKTGQNAPQDTFIGKIPATDS